MKRRMQGDFPDHITSIPMTLMELPPACPFQSYVYLSKPLPLLKTVRSSLDAPLIGQSGMRERNHPLSSLQLKELFMLW